VVYRIPAGAKLPVTPEQAEKMIDPSGSAAGLCFDGERRIVVAQFDGKVRRSKSPKPGPGSEFEVVAEKVNGNTINKANDLVVAKNGLIYVTEFAGGNVLRISTTGEVTIVATEIKSPNGITLSPDEKRLFVAEYGSKKVWVCDVNADGTLGEKAVFAETTGAGRGSPDGLKVDEKGNLYSTGPGGIFVFSPTGEKLGVIAAPGASNFCFGGTDGKTLYITAGGSVKSCRMNVAGARVQQAN
jgi:gluconolactonase